MPDLRHRKHQDPVFVDREISKPFDPKARKMKIANWLADVLFKDFLERKGLDREGQEKPS